jgi:hypothetical protein
VVPETDDQLRANSLATPKSPFLAAPRRRAKLVTVSSPFWWSAWPTCP